MKLYILISVIVTIIIAIIVEHCSPFPSSSSSKVQVHSNGGGNDDDDDKQTILQQFEQFKIKYNRSYASAKEEQYRCEVFAQNFHLITEHNAHYRAGKYTYTLAVNRFADLTLNEFQTLISGGGDSVENLVLTSDTAKFNSLLPAPVSQIPESFDWLNKGKVTEIKDQLPCTTGWIYAAISTIESVHAIKTGHLVSLSEQSIIDCAFESSPSSPSSSTTTPQNACQWHSLPETVYRYVMSSGGVDTEQSYPKVVSTNGSSIIGNTCNRLKAKIGAKISNYHVTNNVDPNNLQRLITTNGPVVALVAITDQLKLYSSGVYQYDGVDIVDDTRSTQQHSWHAITIIGFNVDWNTLPNGEGIPYWVMKNSWSRDWGERGYLRLTYDVDGGPGAGGMANYIAQPLI